MLNLICLSNAQLESLYNDCDGSCPCDGDLSERIALELMTRPDAAPESYDLLWEMQDLGWNGRVTQDERDAR